MKIEVVAGMLILMLLVTTPAFAGGYIILNTELNQSLNLSGEHLKSLFNNNRFISGTRFSTEFNESVSSNLPTKLTDFNTNFTDTNAYFALTKGNYTLQFGNTGETSNNKSVNVNMYAIMPDTFDTLQNIDMHFLMANLTQAEVTFNLTYKGKTYQFVVPETLEDNVSSFNLALYPYCEEFEKAGLVDPDLMTSTFDGAASSSGMDYSSSFTISAVKD